MEANGWALFAHPLLLDQLEKLVAAVERERARNPRTYRSSANAKLLAALDRLLFETIPSDPTRSEYRQGDTLGPENRHWFRAKFGGQRFRLFFRYDSRANVIVYAWVNDAQSLRTYGPSTDAYAIFRKMLDRGNPPGSWGELLDAAKAPEAQKRLGRARRSNR